MEIHFVPCVGSGCGAFLFALFQKIIEAGGDENVFISPLSVAMCLGMAYNGADGSTREEMAQTLELSGLSVEQVNGSYRYLIETLAGLDPTVRFDIANSIWYNDTFPEPRAEFLNACQDYFSALVTGLNFGAWDAAATINAWVEENTNGRIDQIVDDPIDPLYVMFLINAIYFKGDWTYRFDPELTDNALFTLPDGSETTCRMMTQRGRYWHYTGDDFWALDLPYGGADFRMTIVLPDEGVDLDSLIASIDPQDWDQTLMDDWLTSLHRDSLNIYIPKFALEYELYMKEVLTALGMDLAFTPAADFTNMYSGGGVWIDEVKHKTFIEVNEEGTEAAAVTSTAVATGISEDIFLVNRPFAFVIRENYSGTILFIGKIVDPTG
ncbi:serpin family protein [Candidatus Zixiibacteriota bacterium]